MIQMAADTSSDSDDASFMVELEDQKLVAVYHFICDTQRETEE
jgi:hypothetical protein